MNATNRGVNRVILCIVGVLLLASGAVAVTVMVWPAAAEWWKTAVSSAVTWMQDADEASRISDATTVSWFLVAVLAVLLLIVVIAVVVVARLGGGRSGVMSRLEAGEGTQGAVTIHHGFASDAISHSLAEHDDILFSRVRARRVKGEDVLHVSVTPRQNTSPAGIADTVSGLVDNLAILTGKPTPTLVSIHAGIRSRLASDQSRVN